MRCALVSLDSTMRSNATVGPPLECLFYRRDSLLPHENYCKLEETHPYLLDLRHAWDESIRIAFDGLPSLQRLRGRGRRRLLALFSSSSQPANAR
jgi:putative proteasome-type protease